MKLELARRNGTDMAAREQQQLARDLLAAQLPAKKAAARIQAAALAAHTGLNCVETLTGMEIQAVQRYGPFVEARARAIVDSYTGLVTTELSRLALMG